MNDEDLRAEIDRLVAMQDGLRDALADAVERLVAWDSAHDERDRLRIQVDRLVEERDRLRDENERMTETLTQRSIGPVFAVRPCPGCSACSTDHLCPACRGPSRLTIAGHGYRGCDACGCIFRVEP
jgi:hypothetical protein